MDRKQEVNFLFKYSPNDITVNEELDVMDS